ncbi:3-oxoadipate enol-lactonase [Noviherbaspirillum galbum]|uniref:3-oxoadipate enol-lactonase n=1 Tax=Noviherbaspirillum galbum TaxID=2709383 RepID=A0A6B3SWF5_9BURK|nr:3-oxoadipate enol-lactonase [Noviherbaspirillum galbum]NEX62019.1 3-oxoadipate enol-lactonase [Noviherbaspirillum galbum]
MPFLDLAGIRLHYDIEGREGAPWLILSNSLGTTMDMWQPQLPALRERFRVLRYDTRGHGQSGIPAQDFAVEQLGRDVLALMDHLGIERAHFCGLSMGGMTGIWLGIHAGARIDRLVLCNTSAHIGPPELWNARIDKVRNEGMAAIVPAVIERWFTPAYRQRAPEEVERVRRMLLETDPQGYVGNCAAVRDMDQRGEAATIANPALVIAGTHDLATPAADGRWLAGQIKGAAYVELDAAHLSNWEQADMFTAALTRFLEQGDKNG